MFKLFYLCRERPHQELAGQIVYLAFSLFLSLISLSMNVLMNEYCHFKNCAISKFHRSLSD